jgi:hypothetical protein
MEVARRHSVFAQDLVETTRKPIIQFTWKRPQRVTSWSPHKGPSVIRELLALAEIFNDWKDICWRKPVAGQSIENHQKVLCFDGAVLVCIHENSSNFSKLETSLVKKIRCSSYIKGWMPDISDTLDKNFLPGTRFRICKE